MLAWNRQREKQGIALMEQSTKENHQGFIWLLVSNVFNYTEDFPLQY